MGGDGTLTSRRVQVHASKRSDPLTRDSQGGSPLAPRSLYCLEMCMSGGGLVRDFISTKGIFPLSKVQLYFCNSIEPSNPPLHSFPFKPPKGCLISVRPAHVLLQVSYLNSGRCSPHLKGPHTQGTLLTAEKHPENTLSIPEASNTKLTCFQS